MTSGTYEIGRRADHCAATGAPLSPGDAFVAVLLQVDESETIERRDYAAAAWDALVDKPRQLVAFWRSIVPEQRSERAPSIDPADMLMLFEQLQGSVQPQGVALRYVLALMLLRRRVLAPAGWRESAATGRAMLVRIRGTPADAAPIEVEDPALDDRVLADVTDQLRALLRIDQ